MPIDLGEHFLEHALLDHKAVLRGQLGDLGEIRARKRVHFMRGIGGNDLSAQLFVDAQGHGLAFHDTNGLHKLLCIDNIAAGLFYLGVDHDTNALGHHLTANQLCHIAAQTGGHSTHAFRFHSSSARQNSKDLSGNMDISHFIRTGNVLIVLTHCVTRSFFYCFYFHRIFSFSVKYGI